MVILYQIILNILMKFNKIDDKYLITGVKKESEIDYNYCSTARSYFHLCGKNGRKYQENNIER